MTFESDPGKVGISPFTELFAYDAEEECSFEALPYFFDI